MLVLWFKRSTHKRVNQCSKDVRQTQGRPESPTVILIWHACKYAVHKLRQENIRLSNQRQTKSSLILCGIIARVACTLGKAASPARTALPISTRVCRIFVCPIRGVAARVWDYLACAQMLMRVTEYGTSALEIDSGRRNNPCRTRESNPRQYCAQFFGLTP